MSSLAWLSLEESYCRPQLQDDRYLFLQQSRHAVVEQFVKVVPVLPFDEAASLAYASLPFRRARFDRLIAAHALSLGAIIVSNNGADFADVPGLVLENWTV